MAKIVKNAFQTQYNIRQSLPRHFPYLSFNYFVVIGLQIWKARKWITLFLAIQLFLLDFKGKSSAEECNYSMTQKSWSYSTCPTPIKKQVTFVSLRESLKRLKSYFFLSFLKLYLAVLGKVVQALPHKHRAGDNLGGHFLLSPCGYWGSKSGLQAWRQVPYPPTKPSHQHALKVKIVQSYTVFRRSTFYMNKGKSLTESQRF